ncbi:hypothetical protein HYC85_030225 [Camellia sinensis]|uniref:Strictosidine synthase conserved region domain-containing protein n=1 Tax=Camellia sinensis TaxID=4442 RepID=A0A7J7G3Y9_CAMSI|nr:hypothetical protein HYC85_030225 [Camellia sinensis]
MWKRPLGLSFGPSGTIYITDAYFGLLKVGPNGGLATQIATSAKGVDFHLLIGVDVHPITETVYFADASTTFELRSAAVPSPQSTGSFLLQLHHCRVALDLSSE